jgi:hypothetical protein
MQVVQQILHESIHASTIEIVLCSVKTINNIYAITC